MTDLRLDDVADDPARACQLPPAARAALVARAVSVLAALLTAPAVTTNGVPAPANPDPLLTVPEAAARLAVPSSLVYDLIRRGRLPAVHIGKYVRINATALEQWMREHAAQPLDTGPSSTYSRGRDGEGPPTAPPTAGDDAGRVRGRAGDPPEQPGPAGAGRDRHQGVGRPPGAAPRGPRAVPAPDDATDETRW